MELVWKRSLFFSDPLKIELLRVAFQIVIHSSFAKSFWFLGHISGWSKTPALKEFQLKNISHEPQLSTMLAIFCRILKFQGETVILQVLLSEAEKVSRTLSVYPRNFQLTAGKKIQQVITMTHYSPSCEAKYHYSVVISTMHYFSQEKTVQCPRAQQVR